MYAPVTLSLLLIQTFLFTIQFHLRIQINQSNKNIIYLVFSLCVEVRCIQLTLQKFAGISKFGTTDLHR